MTTKAKPAVKTAVKPLAPALKPFKVGEKVRVIRTDEVGRYVGVSTSLRGNFCSVNFAEPRKPADTRKFRRSALEHAS